jgi:hypothetical protein
MPAELVVPPGADQVQHDSTEAKFSKFVLHIFLTLILILFCQLLLAERVPRSKCVASSLAAGTSRYRTLIP